MRNRTIIVIDNDRAILRLLEDVLIDEEYNVQSYLGNQASAMYIHQAYPALVLLELRRKDAHTTLRLLDQLRKEAETVAIPVIVMSTDKRLVEELDLLLRNFGCSVLLKPFDLGHLLACIERAIDCERGNTQPIVVHNSLYPRSQESNVTSSRSYGPRH